MSCPNLILFIYIHFQKNLNSFDPVPGFTRVPGFPLNPLISHIHIRKMVDYYKTLDVSKAASDAEIKKA